MTKEELHEKIITKMDLPCDLETLTFLWQNSTTIIERMAVEHEFMRVWNELYPEDK